LVSKRNESIDAATELDPADPNVVELLGRGTFGHSLNDAEYHKNRVLVQKVDVGPNGSFAWHITDESQKASIAPVRDPGNDALAFEAAAQANPALLEVGGGLPFENLNAQLEPHAGKFATFGSLGLALTDEIQRAKLKQIGNHFTIDSGGLFTNPVTGGLKRDLTPLLLAKKSDPRLGATRAYRSRKCGDGFPRLRRPDASDYELGALDFGWCRFRRFELGCGSSENPSRDDRCALALLFLHPQRADPHAHHPAGLFVESV
jgi:hypothetical protein